MVTTTALAAVVPTVTTVSGVVPLTNTTSLRTLNVPPNSYSPQDLPQTAIGSWVPKFNHSDLYYGPFEPKTLPNPVIEIVGVVTNAVVGVYGNAIGPTFLNSADKLIFVYADDLPTVAGNLQTILPNHSIYLRPNLTSLTNLCLKGFLFFFIKLKLLILLILANLCLKLIVITFIVIFFPHTTPLLPRYIKSPQNIYILNTIHYGSGVICLLIPELASSCNLC